MSMSSGANAVPSLLDQRICQKCPLGPEGGKHRWCKRCEADIEGVTKRREMCISIGKFIHRGVDFGPAMEYDLLPILLPPMDPAA